MTGTNESYRSNLPVGRDGFASLVRAEWTKFTTVRGWVVGLLAAAAVTVLIGLVSTGGGGPCNGGGGEGQPSSCQPPVGPGGEAVVDGFSFVHQPLDGDGSITVRVASLSGLVPADGEDGSTGSTPGLEEWAKAGLIVKQGTEAGSAYAAVMVTGGHGVRMQHNFVHDTPAAPDGVSSSSPRWLRLTRTGDEIVGYESADGQNWSRVGRVRLDGLSSTVEAGLFVTSPAHEETTQSLGGSSTTGDFTEASATFDRVGLQGRWPNGKWSAHDIGGGIGGPARSADEVEESDGTFTVTGSGDIAPAVAGPEGNTVEQSLVGAFAGLIVLIVIAAMSMTTEYRRGMIRTTFAASPRRGQVLAAKAVVVGSVTFLSGLAAAVVAFELVGRIRRDQGNVVLPVTSLTELRVVVGTAALLAVAAVLALALGAVFRRSAAAVTAAIVLIVLPYILAIASVLPSGPAEWLLRVSPAAGFAIQQSIPAYSQVSRAYTPVSGYYPLAPWAGFAVLCAWTLLALGLATALVRRRDV
jgi:ABC-type transport system involved in multi-copper enzyme maturation permease subunit